MLTSELIAKLQAHLKLVGDLPVEYEDPELGGGIPIEDVTFHPQETRQRKAPHGWGAFKSHYGIDNVLKPWPGTMDPEIIPAYLLIE